MASNDSCPQCGAVLPADAPSGICPSCLMQAGLASQNPYSPTQTRASQGAGSFTPPPAEELDGMFTQMNVIELIGVGGMGAVYKAKQETLDRTVAIKILPPEVGGEPTFNERFAREARALASLNHQNIVALYDFGEINGQYYFVMEYVDGCNLREMINAEQLESEQALSIVKQVCEALQFAHSEGVVHRDVKPENILVDRQGRVKIADFGLAKLLASDVDESMLTGTRQVMGTAHYMAPEQVRGTRSVDHRADIYSLGVVFYELLTGNLPIGRFDLPSQKVALDVRLDDVVLRTLASEPDRRYQQISDVKVDIDAISHSAQPSPRLPDKAAVPPAAETPVSSRSTLFALLFFVAGNIWLVATLILFLGRTVERTSPTRYSFFKVGGWWSPTYYNLMMVFTILIACGCFWVAWSTIKPKEKRRRLPLQPLPKGITPRLSRKALWGALWGPMFFAVMFLTLFVTNVDTEPGPSPQPTRSIGGAVSESDQVVQRSMASEASRSWLQWVLIFTVLPLGAAAPFATTILGCLAIGDIRRSQGYLTGLPLAIIDALLFPLLLLDAIVLYALTNLLYSGDASDGSMAVSLGISLLACLVIDALLIRLVWLKSAYE